MTEPPKVEPSKDFFITYTRVDQDWAEWVASTLEKAGRTTVIQAWDFQPGDNFVQKMNEAIIDCRHTIGILSPAYLKSIYTRAEWTAAYKQTLTGRSRGYIPVKVAECDPEGLLGPIVSIDLFDVQDAEERRRLLLDGVRGQVPRVPRNPGFPGARPAATP